MPYLPGTSIKGALRDKARHELAEKDVTKVFGPDTANASEHAGSVVFGDANLFLLPVRSIAGTFAWVTSPYLLSRYLRDLREAGKPLELDPKAFSMPDSARVRVCKDSIVVLKSQAPRVFFEDLDFAPDETAELSKLASSLDSLKLANLQGRLCVVHDDVMSYLAQHAMDVVTRVSLDEETKTAKKGQLWTEESLPTESVLVSVLAAMPSPKAGITATDAIDKLKKLFESSVQFGGKATVGRGRCEVKLA
jgi:CRISPR-associated protein Cmr4